MPSAVLRVDDQLAERAPTHCVLTGVKTDTAVRVTAIASSRPQCWTGLLGPVAAPVARVLGRQSMPVVIAVARGAHLSWQRRSSAAFVALCLGIGSIVVGTITHDGGFTTLGGLLVVFAIAYRLRSQHNFWLSARLRPERGEVVVTPAHGAFDADARALFRRALLN